MKGPSLRYRLFGFLRRTCWPVIPITTAIVLVGIAMQWSVDADLHLPTAHLLRVFALLLCAVVAVVWGAKRWRSSASLFYATTLAMLILVLWVGRATNNSQRWLDIALGFKLQPSEFMKMALILVLARWFADHPRPTRLKHIWKPGLLSVMPALLILVEPDLGTALVFVPLFFAMVWLAGLPWRSFRWLLLIPLLLAPAGWLVIQDYQKARIQTWYAQEHLSADQRDGDGFHLWHSKIAVGSGGATGMGWGKGPENRLDNLPERHNDFVFPVLAEEFGFFGASVFLLLYASLGLSLLTVAGRYRDPFSRLVLGGIGVHFLVHLCLNVGVTLGVWPTTGLPLPMVSFGGSSMMVSGLSLGIALVIGAERAPMFSNKAFEA
jgi:rod shape determining protein RodA